jgi:hypothetical protein
MSDQSALLLIFSVKFKVKIVKLLHVKGFVLPVLHGEYSENFEKESEAVKQVPTGSRRRLLMEK